MRYRYKGDHYKNTSLMKSQIQHAPYDLEVSNLQLQHRSHCPTEICSKIDYDFSDKHGKYCFLTPFLSLFRHLFYNKRDIISEMLYSIRERGTQKVIIYLAGLSSDYAILYWQSNFPATGLADNGSCRTRQEAICHNQNRYHND